MTYNVLSGTFSRDYYYLVVRQTLLISTPAPLDGEISQWCSGINASCLHKTKY